MTRANSVLISLAGALILIVGFGSVGPLAQGSPPSPETVQPTGEGAGPSVEAPPAEQPAPSGGVEERGVQGVFSNQLGTLQISVQPQPFAVVSYGGKCLDFGPPPQVSGAPVFLYGCNGTIAQQVLVQEINSRHEVILRAGTKVIGVRGGSAPPVLSRGVNPNLSEHLVQNQAFVLAVPEPPLELQDEQNRQTVLSSGAGQIFALDGDSMILAADRTKVVKVQSNRGKDRTPLVLERRDLADNEFWTFVATDKSNRKPTSGFVRVPREKDFVSAVSGAHPGTVIEVDLVSIDLSNVSLPIPEGVTIRSNRRGTNFGAELRTGRMAANGSLLEVAGQDVRITGIRLRGPSRSTDRYGTESIGIAAHDSSVRTIIDHNDLSDWPRAAVSVSGNDGYLNRCPVPSRDPRALPQNVRVTRNFIHHNQAEGFGYGIVSGNGAFPLIEGNTFYNNRHAIAADSKPLTKYRARYNLVLSAAPSYGLFNTHEHDFDMHGSGPLNADGSLKDPNDTHHVGGVAGEYAQIHRNTFLGTNRNNLDLRGEPCFGVEFHQNVSLRDRGDAVDCDECGAGINKLSYPAANNQFNAINPTTRLGVGDFDGDGRDDLFLATGAAWYYAPAGVAEWRFLNAQTDGIGSLLFGDFDADGRTDVFTQHGSNWDVSWGGASRWETINVSGAILGNAAVGDFVGDRRADVFYADGQRWWVSDGGVGPFVHTQDSSYRAADLGFGDFNGDGKTDVVGVVSGQWMVSLSATGSWAGFPLRSALTKTMAGLIIADFNGNGRADVAQAYGKSVSYDGRGNWTDLPARPGMFAAVGRFDANPGADILFYWTNDNHLGIQSSGVGAAQRQSRQHMR